MKRTIKAIFGGIGILIPLSVVFLFLLSRLFVNRSVDLTSSFYSTDVVVLYFLKSLRFFIFMIVGFVTAKIAQKKELLYGFLLGIFIFISFSAIKIYITWSHSLGEMTSIISVYYLIAAYSSPINIIGCALGAYLQKRIKDKKENKESLESKIDRLGKE